MNGLKPIRVGLVGILILFSAGCMRPYQVPVFETIETSEEGFLLPLTGDTTKQAVLPTESALAKSLVSTKQVEIPQRWIQTGRWGPTDGKWQPAARLVKVDRAPVTREWTADTNTGTSNKNEAIWVMTSDQVEFSTGWTCTARIAATQDAVRFLWNYPNGSLKDVLDTEVRAKLQATFGIEVTDRPMDELRMRSTPIIQSVEKKTIEFFKDRGITITNLGITGGYVYKDKKNQEIMSRVFQAEQDQAIAKAATRAQEEKNKAILLAAESKAKAVIIEKDGEARAIKAVADARNYEIEKAKENLAAYVTLKRIELEQSKLTRWDGKFPLYFLGAAKDSGPEMLLNIPSVAATEPEAKRGPR